VRRRLVIRVMLIASPALGQTYRYEAESALSQDVHGVNVSLALSGSSGTGYLTRALWFKRQSGFAMVAAFRC